MSFEDRVKAAYRDSKSILSIGLDVQPGILPPEEPLRMWERLIEETYSNTLAYKFNLSGYVGDKESLETLAYLRQSVRDKGRIAIVDSKANDVSHTQAVYGESYLQKLGFDACTVNAMPWLDDAITPLMPYLGEKGIFVLVYTTSPSSEMALRNFKINGYPMWQYLALKVANDWSQKLSKNEYSPIGIVAGPREKELAEDIRGICDTQTILVPGIGAQGVPVKNLKYLKKNNSDFPGVIANVGRGIIGEWSKTPNENPVEVMTRKAKQWNEKIRSAI